MAVSQGVGTVTVGCWTASCGCKPGNAPAVGLTAGCWTASCGCKPGGNAPSVGAPAEAASCRAVSCVCRLETDPVEAAGGWYIAGEWLGWGIVRARGARPGDYSDGGEGPQGVGRTAEAGERREGAVEGPSDGRLARNGREVGLRERVTGRGSDTHPRDREVGVGR